ncbi:MAG: AAA domain-containing protein, partial [Flavisolibacter sp.]
SQRLTDGSKERQLYELAESESNPYSWEFDVCNMVLGNFNYKKMSLVEDYNSIIEQNISNPVFRQLFSDQPKLGQEVKPDVNDPENWFHVLTADPTQIKSILQARSGMSYIIQGPPGTGKSQTITNLIADFVARDKKVLFVCEKRAALDVVYHRLKQYGLDELCCYIHDSQHDKKSFIKDLSDTYEAFMNKRMDRQMIRDERSWLLAKLTQHLTYLKNYHLINTYNPEAAGIEVRKLIERLIFLKPHIKELTPAEDELLPLYKEWNETGQCIKELSDKLFEVGAEPFFSAHPFSKVRDAIFLNEQPLKRLSGLIDDAQRFFEEIEKVFLRFNISASKFEQFNDLRSLIENVILLFPVAEHDQVKIVDPANAEAQQFQKEINSLKLLQDQYKKIQEENINWINKPGRQETGHAMEIAGKYEQSFWRHFSGRWRKLKKSLHAAYNFSAHAIFPGYLNILTQLDREYELDQKQRQLQSELEQHYQFTSLEAAYLAVQRARSRINEPEVQFILNAPEPNELVRGLYKLNNTIRELDITLKQIIFDHDRKKNINIQEELDTIQANTDDLNELLPSLRNFSRLPDVMKKVLRTLPLTPLQLEAAVAFKTIRHIYANNKEFAETDASSIGQSVLQIERLLEDLLKINALLIKAKVQDQFLLHAGSSTGGAEILSEDSKTFLKDYAMGRKILENEFGKTMRYKSIRELSNRESGKVLKDLKPVWLMSPLSVSDSLPIQSNYFDVVIFDEASQITLEEGIP